MGDRNLADRSLFLVRFVPYLCFAGVLVGVGVVSQYALIASLTDGISAALLMLGPSLAGLWLLPFFGCHRWPIRWQLLIGWALGLGGLAILVLLLGLAGMTHRGVWLGILVLLTSLGCLRLRMLLTKGRSPRSSVMTDEDARSEPKRTTHWLARALWLLAVPFGCLALIAASHAPGLIWQEEGFGYDVLEYHLQVPKEYLQAGIISYLPHNVYANFPANVEMLYLLGMIVLGSAQEAALTANFMHLVFGGLFVFAAWTAGRDHSKFAGAVAGVVAASLGWLAYLSGLAYVENGLLFFGLSSMALLVRCWRQTHRNPDGGNVLTVESEESVGDGDIEGGIFRRCLLVGLLAGLACGCKYTAVPMVALPVALAVLFWPGQSLGRRFVLTIIMLIGTGLSFSPWLVKNVAFTGNPVFPLASSVFPAEPPGWGPDQTEQWVRGHTASPDERTSTGSLRSLWQHVPADADQRFGWLVLLLPFVGCWGRRRDRGDGLLLFFLLLQVGVWLLATHHYARFATVFLIPLVLLAGRSMGTYSDRTDGWLTNRKRVVLIVLLAGVAWNYNFAVKRHIRESVGGAPPSIFSAGMYPGYEYYGYVNEHLPADAKILLVGDARAFYYERPVDYCVVFNRNPFAEAIRAASDEADVMEWLRRKGYSHVLVHWMEIDRLRKTYGFSPKVSRTLFQKLERHGLSIEREFSLANRALPYVTLYRVGE